MAVKQHENLEEIPTEQEVQKALDLANHLTVMAHDLEKKAADARDAAIHQQVQAHQLGTIRRIALLANERTEAMLAHPFTPPNSVLFKHQKLERGWKIYSKGEDTYRIKAIVRYDDECGNGHNSFSITGVIERKIPKANRWMDYSGGCIHEDIAKHFPELAPLIKWHLTSSNGPMYYIENTLYWVETSEKKPEDRYESDRLKSKKELLDNARGTAVWPEATDEDLKREGLINRLMARFPVLMADFKSAVEGLGLVY